MGRLKDIVVDCEHPASLARFWAAAIDGYDVAPYDEEELTRLRSLGIDNPEDDPTVLVEQPGVSPRLFFQQVPEHKVTKNRVHLDLQADDVDAEVARLVDLGAVVVTEHAPDTAIRTTVRHDARSGGQRVLRHGVTQRH
jgi:hypothetical protein